MTPEEAVQVFSVNKDRNLAMYKMRQTHSLAAVGRHFGLSAERVRQIMIRISLVQKYGLPKKIVEARNMLNEQFEAEYEKGFGLAPFKKEGSPQ